MRRRIGNRTHAPWHPCTPFPSRYLSLRRNTSRPVACWHGLMRGALQLTSGALLPGGESGGRAAQ
eukprot:3082835-Pyramimonas_sp.AAC.1